MKSQTEKEIEKEIENLKKQEDLRYPFDEFWFRKGFEKGKELIEDKT